MALSQDFMNCLDDLKTVEDCREAWNLVKARHDELVARKGRNFRKGQKVQFEGRNGELLIGTIDTVNQKTVTVTAENGERWRVHLSLVTVVN